MFWSARKILFLLLTLTMGGKPLHRWEGRSRSGMTIVLLKYTCTVHNCTCTRVLGWSQVHEYIHCIWLEVLLWEAPPQVGGERQERDDHCCARSPTVHCSAGLEYVVLKSSALLFKWSVLRAGVQLRSVELVDLNWAHTHTWLCWELCVQCMYWSTHCYMYTQCWSIMFRSRCSVELVDLNWARTPAYVGSSPPSPLLYIGSSPLPYCGP